MAGINVRPEYREFRVLVCWECKMFKQVMANAVWLSLGRKTRTQWKKNSPYHWQALVRGEVLDYWPTKRKWRFRDKTHIGDVDAFVRSLS
jgi:hypothetical protein